MQISRIRIFRLHGRLDVDLEVQENTLILVGVNGLGKTTILTIIYLVLSRQWSGLLAYQFHRIVIDIGMEAIEIVRDDIELGVPALNRLHKQISRYYPPNATASIRSVVEAAIEATSLLTDESQEAYMARVARVVRDARPDGAIDADRLAVTLYRAVAGVDDNYIKMFRRGAALQVAQKKLDELLDSRVLYLPTFRRIERDIEAIFPDLEMQIRKSKAQKVTGKHEELVEFGMRDVERQISGWTTRLKEEARSQLNSLTGQYLRDVLRGHATEFDPKGIVDLSEDGIDRVLDRVEEHALDDKDKTQLRNVIAMVKNGETFKEDRHKLAANYFARLLDIHEALDEKARPLSKFVSTTKRYLEGKRVVFDETHYTLKIQLDSGPELPLSSLSSGEKQIISLLSRLYLGDASKLAIIIDEPELSLSTEWQRRLLPDIVNSGRCTILIAATHSPFIFDNELDCLARDLTQAITPSPIEGMA
jgi:ABC-type transport system involved in cytochrome c biogenesis ATPase subunit